MESINLKSSDLEHLQKLGIGACATVYKYEDKFVIKVFNKKGIELHDNEVFSKIVGIENGTCVFPNCALEINQKFQGYVMQYIEGTELHKVIKELDFENIISAVHKVENDLKLLSINKIMIEDLNQGGIMWSNQNEIKIIDTDFFESAEFSNQEECYSHNIYAFNTIIEMELGFINGQENSIIDFLQSKDEYNQLYREYVISSLKGNNMSVTELIMKAIEIFEKEFGKRPTNLNEMEEMISEKNKLQNIGNSTMEYKKHDDIDDGR